MDTIQIMNEARILHFVVQLFVLLACARGLGEVFRHFKQPSLPGEILAGLLLGPTLLGRFFPEFQQALFPADPIQQAMLESVAWVGLLFLLLNIGLEIDFSIAWRQRGSACTIALADTMIPVALAFGATMLFPDAWLANPAHRIPFSLFMAAVMTTSAMPVTARVMHDLKLLKTDMGFLVMSALTVNDIIGWVLFAVVLGLFTTATISLAPVLMVLAGTVGFAVLALTLGRRASTRVFDLVVARGLPEPGTSLTLTVLLGLLFGACTQSLGIHALFGFFIAGVVVGEAKSLSEKTRGVISQMVHSLFVPLFFASIGLRLDFIRDFNLPLALLLCGIGIGGRYLGAWAGATWSRQPRINRDLIAIAHTPGGMMEIVVAHLALHAGLITAAVFVAIVFTAVFSALIMGPWMAHSLGRRAAVKPVNFLSPGAVVAALEAEDRAAVLREMAGRFVQVGAAARERIARAAIAREEEFGTALGEGVAIPHARVDGLSNPMIAYARAIGGIEWNAPDGVAVEHIFLLAVPTGTEDIHVQTLAAIATAMSSKESREALREAPDPAALYALLRKLLDKGGSRATASGTQQPAASS